MLLPPPFNYLLQSWFFFRKHIVSLSQILVPFALIQSLVSLAVLPEEPEFADLAKLALTNMLILPIYQAALIRYMDAIVNDSYLSPFQSIIVGISSVVPLIVVYLLMGIALGAGFALFIIPGLMLVFLLSFTEFICVVEKQNPFKCIEESVKRCWPIFFPLVTGKVVIFAGLIVLQYISLIFLDTIGIRGVVTDIAAELIFAVLFSISTIFSFRLYCVEKESNAD